MIDERWGKQLRVRNLKIGESTFVTAPVKHEPAKNTALVKPSTKISLE